MPIVNKDWPSKNGDFHSFGSEGMFITDASDKQKLRKV